MTQEIPRIFSNVFECTLEMISKNFEDYPEHRLNFFNLLRAINNHCFAAFYTLSPAQFRLIMDSIVWSFKHTQRDIAETGLSILQEMFQNLGNTEIATAFYQTYFIPLIQDIFYVLTDTFHKSSFKLQATLLAHMFHIVEAGQIKAPLWNTIEILDPNMNNPNYLREYVVNLLIRAFPNLTPNIVQNFVLGLFSLHSDIQAFKSHLRDFLVQMKEFSAGDNADLFDEEKQHQLEEAKKAETQRKTAVPGLLAPHERQEEMLEL